jgi:hypothetical protein
VGKFHVGDRWADQAGDEWFVYRVSTENAYAVHSGGATTVFTYGRSLSGPVLTRLISSERWIPFAEMIPEKPQAGEKRIVVAYVEDEEDPYLFRVRGGQWVASDEIADWSLSELTPDGAHWRYILPPEAP